MNLEYVVNPRTDGANPFLIFESLDQFDPEVLALKLRKMSYGSFTRTSYWFAVSTVVKSRAGMRCQVCNSTKGLQAHHRTYSTHGYEHKNMMDLVCLCENCHGLFHGHKEPEIPRVKEFVGRTKVKGAIIKPHTLEDLVMPEGDPIVLTYDLIRNCRANGSFTNATLRAFGLNKDSMKSGWPSRLIGVSMTREKYMEALKGKFIYRSGPLGR